MSAYSMSLTIETIRTVLVALLDIFIMWWVLYYALRIVRNNSRTIQIFKGIVLIVFVDTVAKFLGLRTVEYVTDIFMNWGFLAIIIIFQPEIRSLLERIGKSSVFSRISSLTGNEKERLVDQIVTATMLLSKDQTGALISIEQSHSLEDFIATGTRLNSDVTAELLTSLFVTTTPLHDGAVIIQGDKIACASAYFPPTNMELPSRFGARHRAAIGISEITDAVTIVVSEETGNVSIAEDGKIFTVNRKELRDYLLRRICGVATEVTPEETASKGEQQKEELHGESSLVETEEVVPAAGEQIVQTDNKEEKKHHLSLFTDEKEISHLTDDAKLKELDEDASEIKLPHHKNVAVPSYPEQHRHIFTETPSEEKKGGADND